MTRRLNLFLLILALLVAGPYYWLFLDTSPWNVPVQRLTMAELRQLAQAIPGQKPENVQAEMVGWRLLPGNLFAAGSGMKRRLKGVISFVLEVPGKGPVVIDTGTTAALAKSMNLDKFEPAAQQLIDDQIGKASLILVTHEHPDHIGGLAHVADGPGGLAILTKARLNPWQVPQADRGHTLGWPAKMIIAPSISGMRPEAVAPGIVVIPAPGHSPGSQMIYVQLADGAEFLFTGDMATLAASWQNRQPRSRLVTDFLSPEDRRAAIAWLEAIIALKQTAPDLHVIASHDFDWLFNPESNSGILRLNPEPAHNLAGN